MKQLSFDQLVIAPIAHGATTPNPGGPAIAWSTTTSGLLLWNGTSWGSTITDPELKSLEELNTFGFLVRQQGTGEIVTRTLAGTADQIQITDANGVTNPAIALTDTGVNPGTYTKMRIDAQGRVREAGLLTAADIPSDYLNLYRENYAATSPYPVATGANAIAIGPGAQATADGSYALGEQSVARHKHGMVRAAGRFQTSGDAQIGQYILKAVTTNGFQRELFLDGPSGTSPLILPDESTWTFKATITAHRTDGTDGHAGFMVRGVIYRGAGSASTAFQGSPIVEILGSSNPGWSINTTVNTTNGSLRFVATGESGKTIRWLAAVETVEITN